MSNQIGQDVSIYRDVVLRDTVVGDHTVLADDCFITSSSLGRYCKIERRGMIFQSVIGDYSYTGFNTVVKSAVIGKYCSVSWNVSLGGVDHNYRNLTTHPFPYVKRYGFVEESFPQEAVYASYEKPLRIGNDVWIGCNACVMRGVSVGDGAVIGAGAVVTHDVPPYEIWAGVPAKKIGQRFSDEIISSLLALQWWDHPPEFINKHLDLFRAPVSAELLDRFSETDEASDAGQSSITED